MIKKITRMTHVSWQSTFFKYLNPSLQKDKCEHDSWCKHGLLFSTFCAPGFLFMRHKASSGSTQQAEEALVRYNLFTFTHRHASSEASCFWRWHYLETTASVYIMYNNRLLLHSDVVLFDSVGKVCHFYTFGFLDSSVNFT